MRPALAMAGVLAAAHAMAGCGVPIDERLGDYTGWKRLDVTGSAPGHSDSYRVIYVNDIAADPAAPWELGYPLGSVIVKEIRDNDGGAPGDLRYVAIMRRLEPITEALVDDGGWLFSESPTIGGAETHYDFCWARCHVAAPYNGAFYDYRR